MIVNDFRRGLLWVLLLMLMPVSLSAQSAQPLTFFMTFVPNIQFAQMYVGIEKGYFADAGYALTLEYGAEPDGVELIALNERQFGLIAGEQVIVARANGRPVVSVYEWWQQYPIVVAATVESGIASPADLAGRRVGVPGRFGATYSGLVAFLSANNLVEADLNLQEIGFNAPEVICVGGVEAAAVYGNNEPLQVQQRIAADDCGDVTGLTVFPVVDYADLVSNGLVTNEQMIAEQPERVQAMVGAFDRAVQDVIRNPAEAYLLSARHVENLPLTPTLEAALSAAADDQAAFLATNPTREAVSAANTRLFETLAEQFTPNELLQFQVLMETIKLWDAERTGFADMASWEVTQATLLDMGFIDESIALERAFTNAFLPELE